MGRGRLLICALALVGLTAAGCSSPPSHDSPVAADAGHLDSGHPDAGNPDAGQGDAGSDSGPTDPASLAPPPPGQGVQLKIPAFDVGPGQEVQNCYFFKVSDLETAAGMAADQPLPVNRVQIVETPGSHHMNVFRVRTIVNLVPANGTVMGLNGASQCFVSSNWADWPLLANTQQAGDEDWSYPTGVANTLQPTEWLMLQVHYVNAGAQTTPGGGQVAINLFSIPADQVTAQVGTLFATDQNIAVCQSNPTPTFSQGCQFNSPNPVTIIGANGHFHSRGTKFDIFTWDGTSITAPPASDRFYESLDWNDPPMAHGPALATVPAMGGIRYSCSYQWSAPPDPLTCSTLNTFDMSKHPGDPQGDCCYTFGPIVEENEHCNAFVYYYPAQPSGGIICM